jgi:hypothetical protein
MSSWPALVESTCMVAVAEPADGLEALAETGEAARVSERENDSSGSEVNRPVIDVRDSWPTPAAAPDFTAGLVSLQLAAVRPTTLVAATTTSPSTARNPLARLPGPGGEATGGLPGGTSSPRLNSSNSCDAPGGGGRSASRSESRLLDLLERERDLY